MLWNFPSALRPDNSSLWGLFGFGWNANLAALTTVPITTVAGQNSTLTAAQALLGLIQLNAGANGGFQLNLPATADWINAMGPTVQSDGSFEMPWMVMNNNVGQTATITIGDASTTLTGTMTVATNTVRLLRLYKTGPTTLTLLNLGTWNL